MFSRFTIKNNTTGKFDKFVSLIFFLNYILTVYFLFTLPNSEAIVSIIDAVVLIVILGRVMMDPNFNFIYFIYFNFIVKMIVFLFDIFIEEVLVVKVKGDIITIYILLLMLILVFIQSYIFQYIKQLSYKSIKNTIKTL